MTQNINCLIAEHSGFVKDTSNKYNEIILINGVLFPNQMLREKNIESPCNFRLLLACIA